MPHTKRVKTIGFPHRHTTQKLVNILEQSINRLRLIILKPKQQNKKFRRNNKGISGGGGGGILRLMYGGLKC